MTEISAGKINKEEHIFKSTSGVCDIHTVIWYPDKEKYENPVGVVQIAHGMIDHIERFEGLALYLTDVDLLWLEMTIWDMGIQLMIKMTGDILQKEITADFILLKICTS